MRHATPEGYESKADLLRELVPEGIESHRRVCKELKHKAYRIDKILSSPVIRAQQTATITAEHFSAPIQVVDALSYDFDPDFLLDELEQGVEKRVAWVGHEPSVSTVSRRLVGKDILPAGFSKSGVLVLEFPSNVAYGKAQLIDYLHPGNCP